MEEFVSLYDFLHRAAGAELGKQVEAAARAAKIEVRRKEVRNSTYTGKVNMYPRQWLTEYFRTDTDQLKLQL